MAKNITIKVPSKQPQTGELTTFELKGQRMDIDIGGRGASVHRSPISPVAIASHYSAAGSPRVTPYLRISPAERPAPRWP